MAQDGVRAFLTGDKALDELLESLPKKVQNKYARKGTRAGARIGMQEAKALVPVDEGDLERTLTVRTAKAPGGKRLKRGEVGHAVTHREPEASFHSLFLGFGTKYMDPNEYMIDAVFSKQAEIVAANRDAIKQGVEKDGVAANRAAMKEHPPL